MSEHLVVIPILWQFLLAIALAFMWGHVRINKIVSIYGSLINIGIAIWLFTKVYDGNILTYQAGNWSAPFGITFVADALAATLVLLTSISGFAVSVYSAGSVSVARSKYGYFPMLHFLILGLNGAFLTGDIFNLYVWFEIIIISSFVLLTLGGERAQLEGAIKYFTLNMLASVIFLTGLAILYGLAGTLNMADLNLKMVAIENRGLVQITALLFFVAFGIKSAVFPLYFWLPAAYHTPPSAVSAIFGGLLTKVGIYALLRVFSLIFVGDDFLLQVMQWVAILTLISGGLGALVQNNIRKIFSYLIVCHIGYMMVGIGIFTQVAITGTVFYLIHDIIVKTNLFMVSGIIFNIKGTNSMRSLGGLYNEFPKLTLLFMVPLLSLVGIPPLSGFWPKISLIGASISENHYFTIGAIVFASLITLFIVARFIAEVFWKFGDFLKTPDTKLKLYENFTIGHKFQLLMPIVLLAFVSLYIGFGAQHIQVLSETIAKQLVNPSEYINTVLGTSNPHQP